jgi:tungstate transport system substrate-binding protein
MRRPYVLLTPGPRHPATAQQRQAAGLLAEYLLSAAGQHALEGQRRGRPWVFARDSVPAGMSAGVDGQT